MDSGRGEQISYWEDPRELDDEPVSFEEHEQECSRIAYDVMKTDLHHRLVTALIHQTFSPDPSENSVGNFEHLLRQAEIALRPWEEQ